MDRFCGALALCWLVGCAADASGGETAAEADGGTREEREMAAAGDGEPVTDAGAAECERPKGAGLDDLLGCTGMFGENYARFTIDQFSPTQWLVSCEVRGPEVVLAYAAPMQSFEPRCEVASFEFIADSTGATVDGEPMCCIWKQP